MKKARRMSFCFIVIILCTNCWWGFHRVPLVSPHTQNAAGTKSYFCSWWLGYLKKTHSFIGVPLDCQIGSFGHEAGVLQKPWTSSSLPARRKALMVGNLPQASPGHIQCLHLETQQQGAGCSVFSADATVPLYLTRTAALCPPVTSSTRKCGILSNMDAVPYFSSSFVWTLNR